MTEKLELFLVLTPWSVFEAEGCDWTYVVWVKRFKCHGGDRRSKLNGFCAKSINLRPFRQCMFTKETKGTLPDFMR